MELRRAVSASERRYTVTLLFDISDAFDNVWWSLVLQGLKSRECPKNVVEVLRQKASKHLDRRFKSIKVNN